jgi:hypothetical protein
MTAMVDPPASGWPLKSVNVSVEPSALKFTMPSLVPREQRTAKPELCALANVAVIVNGFAAESNAPDGPEMAVTVTTSATPPPTSIISLLPIPIQPGSPSTRVWSVNEALPAPAIVELLVPSKRTPAAAFATFAAT